jgi:hypothetical protein
MRTTRSLISKLRLLGLVLCGLVLSACSQDSEVVTEPVLVRDGIAYYQNTNEFVTGIVEKFSDSGLLQSRANYRDGKREGLFEIFHENGQLWTRGNYIDGEREGLYEEFDRNGNLIQTGTWENGELVETNLDP